MAENTTTLPYYTSEDVVNAAVFIAAMVREGVLFHSSVESNKMVITFTGGH